MHTICSHEPSTHTINSTNVIVDIMLSLDNQWIEEVLGSMGTTGHPYWTAVEHWRRWHLCMMANSTWNLATAFSWRHATTAPSYQGLFVFRRECRWFYITWLLYSSGYSWWYTLWKFDSSILSNFVFYAVDTYKKIWRQKNSGGRKFRN
jgi:hypothetical protein